MNGELSSHQGLHCLTIIFMGRLAELNGFGVRFSVMFHFMFVHYTFSSVWVAEWPPFGK